MIYTITFNPALDYIIKLDNLKIGEINRTDKEKILPGGKGLNVSIVLKNLGVESAVLGFIANFTGIELKNQMQKYGIKEEFIEVNEGMTRINVKINSDKEETAINGNGPKISEKDIKEIIEKINKLNKKDIVILAGNVPKNINNNVYERICSILHKNENTFIVDTTKELLINVLKFKPFLIKPNKDEIEETFSVKIKNNDELIEYGKKLQELGAQNVLISLGGEGAILITSDNNVYSYKAPKGKVVNTVGAGDSMVAGFLAGYLKTNDYKYALKMGLATGSASAFSMELAKLEEVENLLKMIN